MLKHGTTGTTMIVSEKCIRINCFYRIKCISLKLFFNTAITQFASKRNSRISTFIVLLFVFIFFSNIVCTWPDETIVTYILYTCIKKRRGQEYRLNLITICWRVHNNCICQRTVPIRCKHSNKVNRWLGYMDEKPPIFNILEKNENRLVRFFVLYSKWGKQKACVGSVPVGFL